MSITLILQLVVLLGAIAIGARAGGVGMGLWGGVGLAILVFIFRAPPGQIPGDVLLIILTVIMAASAMEAAGGIDYLVRIASAIIRKSPKHVTIIAPIVAYVFTFLAGTGHIFYPLLPVIYEVAMKGKVRPERPIAVATIASQQAITASPVSAATAAMITVLSSKGIGLAQIMYICIPSTLLGVIVAALVQNHIGVELENDPEYKRRLASGAITAAGSADVKPSETVEQTSHTRAGLSAAMFLAGVVIIVLCGLFPSLRTLPGKALTSPAIAATQSAPVASTTQQAVASDKVAAPADSGNLEVALPQPVAVSMPLTIAIIMLALTAIMIVFTGAPIDQILKTKTAQAGLTAVIGILGLAWLGDTFIADNKDFIIGGLSDMATRYPALFSVGLFATSMLLFSQAATAKTLMPLGLSLGLAPAGLAAMFPAVNGYFFIPTYGTLIAAVNFDRSGTTRIGKYVLNHSFMLPGLISTTVAVTTGLAIAKIFF